MKYKNLVSHPFILILLLAFTCCKNDNKIGSKGAKNEDLGLKITTSPATGIASEPYLFSSDNSVFLSWVEKTNDSLYTLLYSQSRDSIWSNADTIASGTDWFNNWADYPILAANKEVFIAHFLQKSASGKYTYDIKYKVKAADSTWGQSILLNEDHVQAEHGFVSIMPYGENFIASWLDGRNTVNENKALNQMTVRAAIINPEGNKLEEYLIDDRVCDCCQTSIAVPDDGPVIVYRDRSEDEKEVRDISIVRLQDTIWSAPKVISKDNWQLNGCPVNGPRASAYKNTVAVAWFSAANDKPKIQVVFSGNGGESFDPAIRLDNGKPIGRVDVEMLDENTAVVSWLETIASKDVIVTMRVNKDGVRSQPIQIATSSAERSSGFPQMALLNDNLYFAWTTNLESKSSVITGILPVSDFTE